MALVPAGRFACSGHSPKTRKQNCDWGLSGRAHLTALVPVGGLVCSGHDPKIGIVGSRLIAWFEQAGFLDGICPCGWVGLIGRRPQNKNSEQSVNSMV